MRNFENGMRRERLRGSWGVLLAMVLACILCGVVALSTPARADEDPKETTAAEQVADAAKTEDAAAVDATGTETTDAEAEVAPAAELPEDASAMGNDVLWSVDQGTFVGSVANDLLGCGETLGVTEAQVAGSVRLAARVITLENATVGESVTLAGQNLTVTGGSSTVAALAGETLVFRSQTGELYLAGRKVVIDGTVNGDVHVYAGELEVGPNAQIAGALTGEVGNDPQIDANAVIGENQLKVSQADPEEPASLFDWRMIAASAASCLLIALLCEWLIGGLTEGAAALIKERPGSFLLWSILGIVVAPLACVLMCVPVVTIPAAIACILVLIAIALVSGGLFAAILGRLVAPGANRFLMAAIFGIVLGVAMAMPYAGAPIRGVVFALTLGYVLCAMRTSSRESRERRAEEAVRF